MKTTTKKRLRTLLFSISGLIVIYIILLQGLSLRKVANRATTKLNLEASTLQDLKVSVENIDDIDALIRFSCDITCKSLSFHRTNDMKNRKANCVGYAQYTSEVLNQIFRLKGLSHKANPVVGNVHLYGVNLHPFLLSILPKSHSSFFKDHDFVEIRLDNGKVKYVDSSLQDLTGMLISS